MYEEWEDCYLGDLFTLEYGHSLPESARKQGQVPVYGSNGIVGSHDKPVCNGPGVIVGRKGSVGEISWSQKNFWPIDTTYFIKLKASNVLRWVYWKLLSYNLTKLNSSTGVPGLNRNDVYTLSVSLPSQNEQQIIVTILDTVDETLRQTEAVIAKLRQVKAGMLHDLLTRGLDENGELRDPIRHSDQFKDSPLGKVPATWEICPLIAFATLQRGFDIIVADQIAGNIPVVSSSGITSYHNEAAVNGLGVIIGRKGKLGEAYFLEGPFWPHDTSLWVKNFHGNDERFTALFLKFLRLERFDAATSVPTLNRNVIHPLLASIPPKSEQIDIVTHIEKHEAVIQREVLVLNKLNTIKKGLMHDLLTGTVRVPPNLLEAAS